MSLLLCKALISGPFLVVVPLTVMDSWINDSRKLFKEDLFNIYCHHGNKLTRASRFAEWKRDVLFSSKKAFQRQIHIVITTYDMIIRDRVLFEYFSDKIVWEYIIVSHKNSLARNSSFVYLLSFFCLVLSF